MLRNWHFDILNLEHWKIAWDLWSSSWVISEPKEWAFVLIIISFIPLWFTGWIALSLISWGKIFWRLISFPHKLFKNFFYKPVKIITTNTGVTPIRKKRSYKEIRPQALRGTTVSNDTLSSPPPQIITSVPTITAVPQPSVNKPAPATTPATTPATFDHSLFKFDDSADDFDFDIDSFDVNVKPKTSSSSNNKPQSNPSKTTPPRYKNDDNSSKRDRSNNNRDSRDRKNDGKRPLEDSNNSKKRNPDNTKNNNENFNKGQQTTHNANGSCSDIIRQKGYEIINRISVKNTTIDYIAVSADRICLCLLDRETGDWLADEERFNDEEPLWFSESSHRISPVRKVALAQEAISQKLETAGLNFSIIPFVIIQTGNIINAEDMFEIWESLQVNVTRIDRGTPKEIRLFARALPEAEKPISQDKLDKLITVLNSIE